MGTRKPKASDIPDATVLAVIDANAPRWTMVHEVFNAIVADRPEMPFKVVQAKIRQMIANKRLGGCGCGCRGDFSRPRKGSSRTSVGQVEDGSLNKWRPIFSAAGLQPRWSARRRNWLARRQIPGWDGIGLEFLEGAYDDQIHGRKS